MDKKIGVYVCECGPNIADKVDINTVITAISPIEDIAVVERFKLLCSAEGKTFLEEQINKHKLTHVVVAACSPKEHEKTFMEVCERAGLNPYLFQLANIREQCAWVTEDKDEATIKTIRLIKAAISRVRFHSSLDKVLIDSNPDVLVIGGGIAGIEASLQLASPKRKVYLVEKTSSLGGLINHFEKSFPALQPVSPFIEKKIQEMQANEQIKIFTESEVKEAIGFFGNFEVTVQMTSEGNEKAEFNVGAIVLATGSTLFNPENIPRYGYRRFDNVLTSLDFEQMNLIGKIFLKNGKTPDSVAIINCVGRDAKGYCSEICCRSSLKFISYLREKIPSTRLMNFYSDMCIPDKNDQQFFEQTKGKNVEFIRSSEIEVVQNNQQLRINFIDEAMQHKDRLVDMVILTPALEPTIDVAKVAELTGISQDDEGFFAEEHEKINPVSTSTEGVFIIGCAQGPKTITETIVQAEAAAGKILSSLIPGKKIEPEVKTSFISESFCIGCKTCISVCSYGAITFNETKKVSVVNEVICRGCGNCVASCPSGAASTKHFRFSQIYQELLEAIH